MRHCTFAPNCAQNKTRTCTPLPAPAPQAGVSTNFTIWARWRRAQGEGLRAGMFLPCALSSALCASFCAQNRTRTCTSLLTLVPETSASTNFAIWATVQAQNAGLRAQDSCSLLSALCSALYDSGHKNNKKIIIN